MIRVIAGTYKGKRLRRVRSLDVRPLPHKLKESLFNIIQPELAGKTFLDGFAGTGAVGIEALSRGARSVFFIDEYYPAIKVIKANLEKCCAEEKASVLHKEFNRAVIQLAEEEMAFDFIFLDPPYRFLEERNPLKVIYKRQILNERGTIILRRHFKIKFEPRFFELKRDIFFGEDVLAFFGLE